MGAINGAAAGGESRRGYFDLLSRYAWVSRDAGLGTRITVGNAGANTTLLL